MADREKYYIPIEGARIEVEKVSQEIEAEVLALLNKLIQSPSMLHSLCAPSENTPAVTAQEATVDDLLRQLPVDENQAEKASFALAVARYEALGSEEYETQRLRRLFEGREIMDELDTEFVRQSVHTVTVDGNGTVRIRLKNNQIIGRENTL